MRILFSGTPAFGHLLPMVPLAQAAERSGHPLAFLTSHSIGAAVEPFPVLPAGPDLGVVLAEVARRTGRDPVTEESLATMAEIFGGTRVDLGIEEALAAARQFAPDLVVAEVLDVVGQLVAAVLDVPWVSFGILSSGFTVGPMLDAVHQTAAARFTEYGVEPAAPLALLDPFPPSLRVPGRVPSPDTMAVRPQPHAHAGTTWSPPAFPGREDRPLVLVTLGTIVDDAAVLAQVVDAVAGADVNVLVTVGDRGVTDGLALERDSVRTVGFVPLDQLLAGVSLVVSAGGAGTVLATLSRGLPLVVLPFVADQFFNAQRVAAAGAGLSVATPAELAAAVRQLVDHPRFRGAAEVVAGEIAAMSSPDEVLRLLSGQLAGIR